MFTSLLSCLQIPYTRGNHRQTTEPYPDVGFCTTIILALPLESLRPR